MARINAGMEDAREQGGAIGWLRRIGLGARAGLTFAQIYLLPTKGNEIPETSRLQPVW